MSTLSKRKRTDKQQHETIAAKLHNNGQKLPPHILREIDALIESYAPETKKVCGASFGSSAIALVEADEAFARAAEEARDAESQKLEPAVEAPAYTIFYKDLKGKTASLSVRGSMTIAEVKEKIEIAQNIEAEQQRLIFSGRQCEDDNTLWHYGIVKESTLHLVLRIRGC